MSDVVELLFEFVEFVACVLPGVNLNHLLGR